MVVKLKNKKISRETFSPDEILPIKIQGIGLVRSVRWQVSGDIVPMLRSKMVQCASVQSLDIFSLVEARYLISLVIGKPMSIVHILSDGTSEIRIILQVGDNLRQVLHPAWPNPGLCECCYSDLRTAGINVVEVGDYGTYDLAVETGDEGMVEHVYLSGDNAFCDVCFSWNLYVYWPLEQSARTRIALDNYPWMQSWFDGLDYIDSQADSHSSIDPC